jgi:hypothetical protein
MKWNLLVRDLMIQGVFPEGENKPAAKSFKQV